jgi:tRNA uridine 5-carbamoylmethylation protein Kti12
MRLIVLTGEPKVGKTHALELLKEVNDGTIEYFQDEVKNSDIFDVLERTEELGVITTNDRRVVDSVTYKDVFVISKDFANGKYYVSTYFNQEEKLDWTKAFKWLKSNSSEEEKPAIVDEFFNFICEQ